MFMIVYDAYITAIAFDSGNILLYFTISFPRSRCGLQYENLETLEGISYWD